MIDLADTLETTLRGVAAGGSFLMALILALNSERARTRRLGALFSFSVGVYVLIAGRSSEALFGVLLTPAIIVAILGTVFFWWFAASLFDDDFRWRWWRIAPFFLLPAFYFSRKMLGESPASTALLYAHLIVNATLFADSFRLALSNVADDLVNPRRRFRVILAASVALFGIIIAGAEIIDISYAIAAGLSVIQAAAIVALNMFFGGWLLTARRGLFDEERKFSPELEDRAAIALQISAADRPIYDRLAKLMDEGVYREEGLSVARLAEKVGAPEHHLRKLINGALGFRNFSAFLNARRIEDAKRALSDPANARKQVLQIALDLGYGSITPFNRAFKQATDKTPSEFRKSSLEKA